MVGVDGSEASMAALRRAAQQARVLHAEVVAVHAWEPVGPLHAPGNAGQCQALANAFADELGCVVASVDYRLAPETPHPGPLHDCYAALTWLHDNADELNVDPDLIAVHGESAGGGLAATLAQFARDQGHVPLRLQVLMYGMLDDRTATRTDLNPHTGQYI